MKPHEKFKKITGLEPYTHKPNSQETDQYVEWLEVLAVKLETIIKAHGRLHCTPEVECETAKFGCLGDFLHNKIIDAKKIFTPPLRS